MTKSLTVWVVAIAAVAGCQGRPAGTGGSDYADEQWQEQVDAYNRQSEQQDKLLDQQEAEMERMTKQGRRRFDARAAVVSLISGDHPTVPDAVSGRGCAILEAVVRQVTPSVRPDDVLAGLQVVAELVPPLPPRAIRLAQGRLTAQGEIVDPLAADDRTSWRPDRAPFIG